MVNFCVAILILKMEEKKQHFRHIMLYYFKKGKNATKTQKKICAVYGDVVTDRTCQKWFVKFRAGDFSLDDAPRSGRPVEVDSDQIETLIENSQHYTTQETADIFKISKSSTENHLHQLDYDNRLMLGFHISEEEKKNLLDRISARDSLLKCNENVSFFKQIVTGNEKWILYSNVERKRLWGKQNELPPTTPKASLQPKNAMFCIWWDWKGVLYYELLPENQTINSNKYCSQLNQMKAALDEKRPELVNRKRIIFHQDNARLHVSLMTKQKLLQPCWEVLIHPPYSPDIAPSDFH